VDRCRGHRRQLARSAIVFFENYYAMTHFAAEGLRLMLG
jgi:hypothetical protein